MSDIHQKFAELQLDKQKLQEFYLSFLQFSRLLTTMTPTKFDDQIVDALSVLGAQPWFYDVLYWAVTIALAKKGNVADGLEELKKALGV